MPPILSPSPPVSNLLSASKWLLVAAVLLVLLLMGRWAQPPAAALASHPVPPAPPWAERRVVRVRPPVLPHSLRRHKVAAVAATL